MRGRQSKKGNRENLPNGKLPLSRGDNTKGEEEKNGLPIRSHSQEQQTLTKELVAVREQLLEKDEEIVELKVRVNERKGAEKRFQLTGGEKQYEIAIGASRMSCLATRAIVADYCDEETGSLISESDSPTVSYTRTIIQPLSTNFPDSVMKKQP